MASLQSEHRPWFEAPEPVTDGRSLEFTFVPRKHSGHGASSEKGCRGKSENGADGANRPWALSGHIGSFPRSPECPLAGAENALGGIAGGRVVVFPRLCPGCARLREDTPRFLWEFVLKCNPLVHGMA